MSRLIRAFFVVAGVPAVLAGSAMFLSDAWAARASALVSSAALESTPDLSAMLRRCGALIVPFGAMLVAGGVRGSLATPVLVACGATFGARGLQRFAYADVLARDFDVDPTANALNVTWLLLMCLGMAMAASRGAEGPLVGRWGRIVLMGYGVLCLVAGIAAMHIEPGYDLPLLPRSVGTDQARYLLAPASAYFLMWGFLGTFCGWQGRCDRIAAGALAAVAALFAVVWIEEGQWFAAVLGGVTAGLVVGTAGRGSGPPGS